MEIRPSSRDLQHRILAAEAALEPEALVGEEAGLLHHVCRVEPVEGDAPVVGTKGKTLPSMLPSGTAGGGLLLGPPRAGKRLRRRSGVRRSGPGAPGGARRADGAGPSDGAEAGLHQRGCIQPSRHWSHSSRSLCAWRHLIQGGVGGSARRAGRRRAGWRRAHVHSATLSACSFLSERRLVKAVGGMCSPRCISL